MNTALLDIRRFEHRVIKYIFVNTIQPKHQELTYKDFIKKIVKPLKAPLQTQGDIVKKECDELEKLQEKDKERCWFIILDGNKMRRCKLQPTDDDIYCHKHCGKPNELLDEYKAAKSKLQK